MQSDGDIVRALWAAFEAREWDAAGKLLHEDVVVEWPQSAERIRGRENVIALNRNYPGAWHIEVERVVETRGRVVSQVRVPIDGRVEYGISFFEVEGGLIRRAVEFWGDTYEAPAWRRQWVEPL